MPYYLIKVERCASCNGAGYIQDPQWCRYWAEYVERFGFRGTLDSAAEIDFHKAFWRAEGYNPLKYNLPPEEVECWDCDGSGTIESRVPLEEALREWIPKILEKIEAREQASLEAADAAAFAAEWEAR